MKSGLYFGQNRGRITSGPKVTIKTLYDDTGKFYRVFTRWANGTTIYEDLELDMKTTHIIVGEFYSKEVSIF